MTPCWGMAMLAFVLSCLLWNIDITLDNRNLLTGAMHLMRQGGLYTRWIEINPPLIYLIYCIPASLILWLKLAPNHALYLFIWTLCAWSLWTVRTITWRSDVTFDLRKRILAAAIAILLIVSLNSGIFADREHLLFILSLPWIIQMLFGLPPARCTIIPAAVGFCLKPYNFVIPAVLILCGGARERSLKQRLFSASALTIAAIAVAYGAFVYAVFPAYAEQVAPLALRVYPMLYIPMSEKLANACLCSVALVAPAVSVLPGSVNRCAWVGFVFSGVACYLLNGGWQYTYYFLLAPPLLPLLCGVSSTGGRTSKGIFYRQPFQSIVPLTRLLVIAGLIGVSVSTIWQGRERMREKRPFLLFPALGYP